LGRSKTSDPAKRDAASKNSLGYQVDQNGASMLGDVQPKSEVAGTEAEAAFETTNEFGLAAAPGRPALADPNAKSREWFGRFGQDAPGGGGQPAGAQSESKALGTLKGVKDQVEVAIEGMPGEVAEVAKKEVEVRQGLAGVPAQESEARYYREGLPRWGSRAVEEALACRQARQHCARFGKPRDAKESKSRILPSSRSRN
jgi:hypothetical protein